MKPSHLRFLSVLLLFLILGVSCAPVPISTPTAVLVTPPATPTLVPVPTDTATATVVKQALFCVWDATPTPDASQCSLPTGEARSSFCTKKVPYTLIAIPEGNTYELKTPGITCTDAGVKNGNQLLTCTGSQATFAMQVCNPVCALQLSTATAQPEGLCPQGYNYLADQNCCQAATTDQAGCVTMKFDIRPCGGIDCSRIKNASSCINTLGCTWVPATALVKAHCGSG